MFNRSSHSRIALIAGVATLAVGGVATTVALATNGSARTDRRGAYQMMGATGAMGSTGGIGGMGAMGMLVKDQFGYLTTMIPHHEEAITSATVLLAGTKSPRMREFARTIINTQSAEVKQMKEWLAAWYPGRETTVDYRPMMGDLTKLAPGANLDRAFLQQMIPHHMAAVMMSWQMVAGGLAKRDEVAPFAEKIRDTQLAEIRMMARWLGGRGGAGMHGGGSMGSGPSNGPMGSMGGGGMGMGSGAGYMR